MSSSRDHAQAYYQEQQRRAWETLRDAQVLSLVRMIRCRHPKIGTRKLLVRLRPQLEQKGLRIGRDRLFTLLRTADLLVKRKRQPGAPRGPGSCGCLTGWRV